MNGKSPVLSGAKRAVKYYRTHFGSCMLFGAYSLAVNLMCLAPLAFLFAAEISFLALLTPVMYVMIAFPLSQNSAAIMEKAIETDAPVVSPLLADLSDYSLKITMQLKSFCRVVLWGIPAILITAAGGYIYSGKAIEGTTDIFSVLRSLQTLGSGSMISGVKMAGLVYILSLLPLFFGVAIHSLDRYDIKNHRTGALLSWIVSIITFLPFAAVVMLVGRNFVSTLLASLKNLSSGIVLPEFDTGIYGIAVAFLLLLQPLLPLKQLIQAGYASEIKTGVNKNAA